MQLSAIIAAAFGVCAVLAAPTGPSFNEAAASTEDFESISDYFNILAKKVHNSRFVPTQPICDMSQAKMSESLLPPPTAGLTLSHVAIGRGVQNYTCAPGNATAAPKAVGAVAALYNVSCVAAMYPELANMLPRVTLKFNFTDDELAAAIPGVALFPTNLAISGKHFFTDQGVPFFNLDTPMGDFGKAACKKDDAKPAPETAAKGQLGEPAVAWLRLNTTEGTEGNIKHVYRLHTAGGSAPATCEGMPEEFSVQYAAQYWFWAGNIPNEEPEQP